MTHTKDGEDHNPREPADRFTLISIDESHRVAERVGEVAPNFLLNEEEEGQIN